MEGILTKKPRYSPRCRSRTSGRRKHRALDSDSESGDDYSVSPVRSPVRPKKKGSSALRASAIRRKYRSGMSAIERETNGGDEIESRLENEEESGDKIVLLMQEVKAGNKMLVELTNRVKKNEKRLKDVENRIKNNPESCSSAGSTPKHSRNRDVPDEVRVCMIMVVDGYSYPSCM